VHITGSAEKPTLELTSEPALDQADILAVLLFGKPARDLGRSESAALQQKALALAAGYVVPELRTSVMNALGVETLDVQMPEGSQAGSVTAGRYVAEDVFVSLGQEFGRRVAQTVGLEYYLGKSVSVRGSTSTRGDSALDLLWRYRY
jgi:autotransporter translocation and assembly factor TamB